MSKYNAKKCEIDGITFDSLSEGRRYEELKLLKAAGEINHLDTHEEFILQPAAVRRGKKIRAIIYEADFTYFDTVTKTWVAEDVKGFETEAWRLKKRMFEFWCDHYELRVTKA